MERRFIVVEGPPGAGKSDLARGLAAALGARVDLEVLQNPFVTGIRRDPRHAFAAQVFFLLDRWRRQADLAQESLLSRGVVADWHFARDRLYAALTLSREEIALYDYLHRLLLPRVTRPDLVVLLQASLPTLARRVKRNGNGTDGHDEGFHKEVAEAYGELFFRYAESPLLVVDTTEVDLDDATMVADLVAVIRKHRGGIGHYKPLGSRGRATETEVPWRAQRKSR
ncbi:MAG: deoxynucleoside kinase [Myxococcota bacterium]